MCGKCDRWHNYQYLVRLLKETDRKKMLAYDKKQISRIHRILIPAVIFTAAVLLGRMDTIMADFGQSEPRERL